MSDTTQTNIIERARQHILDVISARDTLFFGLGISTAGLVIWETIHGPWLVGYGALIGFLNIILYLQNHRRERR